MATASAEAVEKIPEWLRDNGEEIEVVKPRMKCVRGSLKDCLVLTSKHVRDVIREARDGRDAIYVARCVARLFKMVVFVRAHWVKQEYLG